MTNEVAIDVATGGTTYIHCCSTMVWRMLPMGQDESVADQLMFLCSCSVSAGIVFLVKFSSTNYVIWTLNYNVIICNYLLFISVTNGIGQSQFSECPVCGLSYCSVLAVVTASVSDDSFQISWMSTNDCVHPNRVCVGHSRYPNSMFPLFTFESRVSPIRLA